MTTLDVARAVFVPRGKDRFDQPDRRIWGLIPLCTKLSARHDTGGAVHIFEHTDMDKGGPPRHVHHAQDEWFYVVKGDYVMEVGDERFHLKAGDSLLAPRGVPHAWARVGEVPGTLITLVHPAGTFETFIDETAKEATLPSPEEIAAHFAAHGMTVIGPPLAVE